MPVDLLDDVRPCLIDRAGIGEAERRWPGRAGSGFAAVVRQVHEDLSSAPPLRAAEVPARYFPNQPLTIVPLALGLATVLRSAEEAILLAAAPSIPPAIEATESLSSPAW